MKSPVFVSLETLVPAMLFFAFLSGCETPVITPEPKLLNVPQPKREVSLGEVWIGPFLDERPNQNMGPNYFGTFRSVLGNAMARLQMDKPVSEVTSATIGNVLRSLGYRTSPMPSNLKVNYTNGWQISRDQSAQLDTPLLAGRISSLYGRNSVNDLHREVQFTIEICILDPQSRKSIWCDKAIGNDSDEGYRAFADHSTIMEGWVIQLMETKAKELLSQRPISQIWKEHKDSRIPAQQDGNAMSVEDRLTKLRLLLEKKLITEEEYNQKRREILKGL